MKYATVCSGIEAPSSAWHPLGWTPVFFSEIDKAASSVLAHHYPHVPNLGDMTAYADWPLERIDVLCAGTPCQSFSVAGKGLSLNDERGNLTLVFCRLADRFDPEWVVWENVPGILSKEDNPFGCFLAELVGCDTAIDPGRVGWTNAGVVAGPKRTAAWRVIDAQGFVPQRRERVFVVCTRAGSRHHPADVLFETEAEAFGCLGERAYTGPLFPQRESVRGDSAAGGEAWEGASADVVGSLTSSGRGVERAGETRGQDPVIAIADVVGTLSGGHGGGGGHQHRQGDPASLIIAPDIARCVATREGTSQDYETTTMVAQPYSIMPMNSGKDFKARATDIAQPIMAGGPVGGNQGGDFIVQGVAHALRAEGFDASEDGTGRGTPIVPCVAEPMPLDTTQITSATNRCQPAPGNPCHPLAAGAHAPAIAFRSDAGRAGDALTPSPDAEGRVRLRNPGFNVYEELAPTLDAGAPHGVGQPVAFDARQSDVIEYSEKTGPLDTDGSTMGVHHAMRVRRLMPVECSRLQAFRDDYLRIAVNGKPLADGPQYKMFGNSMCAGALHWIGQQIDRLAKGCPT